MGTGVGIGVGTVVGAGICEDVGVGARGSSGVPIRAAGCVVDGGKEHMGKMLARKMVRIGASVDIAQMGHGRTI